MIMEIERRDIAFESDDEIVVETRADGEQVIRGYAIVSATTTTTKT